MSYCRYCGTEINYTRTANGKWLPYDVTGKTSFLSENTKNLPQASGLKVCTSCEKTVFIIKRKTIDYTTLTEHTCKKADITRYQKYLSKQKRNNLFSITLLSAGFYKFLGETIVLCTRCCKYYLPISICIDCW